MRKNITENGNGVYCRYSVFRVAYSQPQTVAVTVTVSVSVSEPEPELPEGTAGALVTAGGTARELLSEPEPEPPGTAVGVTVTVTGVPEMTEEVT
jgi:hypothetical protein